MSSSSTVQGSLATNTSKAISVERESIGKVLFIFAWVIEIMAVLIGLAIAVGTLVAGFAEMEDSLGERINIGHYINIWIGVIPFVMVAAVEACKIPIVGAFYKTTSRKWQYTFGLVLIFVGIITFESAANGLERSFSVVMFGVDKPFEQRAINDKKIDNLTTQRNDLASLTVQKIDTDYDKNYNSAFSRSNEQKNEIQEQINLLRASVSTETVKQYRAELKQARDDRKELYEERRLELQRTNDAFQSQKTSLESQLKDKQRLAQVQLKRAEDNLKDKESQSIKAVDDASIFTKGSKKKDWEQKIEKQESIVSEYRQILNNIDIGKAFNEINRDENQTKTTIKGRYVRDIEEIDKKIERLSQIVQNSVGTKEKEIQENVSSYQQKITSLDSEFLGQIDNLEQKREEKYELLKNNTANIASFDNEIIDLTNEKIELEEEINLKVGTNQIFRMAKAWTGENNAADVDRVIVRNIAFFWYGSLSFMIAFMGIGLALASYAIRDSSIPDIPDKKEQRGHSAWRKLINSIRRYYVNHSRPAPIIKEEITEREIVEVDRVVFKEVPVEVVRKEIVHVPFYTNDENLLNIKSTLSEVEDDEELQ
ncbi:MAG: hypothetical protein QNK49_03585 [Porticoccus sp.]